MSEIKRAIALGFFDGVHIGHGALLERTKQRAAEIGAMPSVLSFDVHPDNLVFGRETPLINSAIGREDIIRRIYGIDNVVFLHFNQRLMRMPWQDFADNIIQELNIGWIVVGHDFCFGYKGEGTAQRLKEYCEERGIGCDIIQPVMLDGRVV
ncbi:MAG: riboflavin biosynthesis protein RibF, partial [Candidatus Limivicinus sp.]